MLFGKKKRRICKLLIVEDDPLVAFDTEHFLREAEFEIVATVDAMSVIRDGHEIDLVLVDISLADGSGIDVAREAHAHGLPVMFVTGDCPAGGQDVAVGCLAKPYAQRDLLTAIDVIEAVLEGRKTRRLPSGLKLFEKAA
ncbi:MAG: response regulator [Pseudomonadota bacterium]